jgi:hypothetical protein
MRPFVAALVLSFVIPLLVAGASPGSHAEYIGGTVSVNPKTEGLLSTTSPLTLSFRVKEGEIRIPYDRINLLEYGQRADRRYVEAVLISPMFLLSKKRAHFLTVGYTDDDGRQQAMVFRVPKGDIRSVLVSLEARTGRKVTFQDDEARKAGKG